MRLLMGLSWSCYAAFMGPWRGLYGNADMPAVFWGSPPSERECGIRDHLGSIVARIAVRDDGDRRRAGIFGVVGA